MSTVLTVASIENKGVGDEVNVAISIDTDSGDTISALTLVFNFDPSQIEPLSPAASAGSLTQSWGSPVANATQGQIRISQSSATTLSDNNGEILILNFKIKEGAANTIALDLDETSSSIMEGQINFSSNDGVILLSSTGSHNSTPTGSVAITGTPTQGQTLTADTSAIADDDGLGSFSYQWKANGVDINGANQSTFALTQDQVGKAISVTASYTDGGKTAETLTSAATAAVANTNDAPTLVKPIADQGAKEDSAFSFTLPADTFNDVDADDTLTLSATLNNGSPLPTWLTFTPNTGVFSGTPANADVGSLSIKVTATDSSNAIVADQFLILTTNTNDSPTGTVVIAGTPTQGQTLTADTFAIADDDGLGSFSYQWKANGVDINGANQSTFALTQAQVGKAISVTASYTDGGKTAETLTSTATAAVTNSNDSPTGTVVITGTPTQGQTLTADTSAIADADGLGSFSYQWKANGVDINGANQSTFALTQDQVGKAISVTASYTDGGKTAETLTSTATAAVANTNDAPTLAKPIADQGAKEDSAFSFTLPADTFNDVDADDTLTLSATLNNGSPLPTWLTFTPNTGVFSGTPANADVGSLSIKVTATDSSNAVVADQFLILTTNTNDAPTLAKPIADQGAKEDSAFSFTLPADIFNDVDADDTLTLSATLDNGSPLPTWLTFTPNTGVFSGTPANADVGSLSIKVTATDSSNAVVADQFLILTTNTNDSPTGTVVITGTPTQGQTLTADTSAIADADGLGSFSYQWKANGVDINGANQSTFALTQAQVGKAISVTASYTDGGKTAETLTSTATAAVTNSNDSPTGTVVITGTPTQGQTLTADTSAIADDDGLGSFSYQWKANGVDINGANQSTFALTQDQVGKAISVTASYTDGGKTAETLTSAATAAVANTNDAPTLVKPIADQGAKEDSAFSFTLPADTFNDVDADDTLTLSATLNNGSPLPTWLTFTPNTGVFSGTPANADVGSLSIKVTATDSSNAIVADQFLILTTNTNDSPTGTVVIAGTPTQGQTLTADTFAIADDDGLGSFSYQWKANGVDINGANQSTFALTQDQVGKAISVTASYTDGGKTAETLTSTATAAVTNSNDSPTGTVVITGTPTQGQTLTADTSAIADADGLGSFSYQWKANGVDINGANQSTFALTQDQVGKAISVTASYTDGGKTAETLTSTATAAVANTNDAPTLAKPIADQGAKEDSAFSFTLPADIFNDVDADDTLTLSATLDNGSPLPTWLTFTPNTGVFSGTPANADVGSLSIKVTATDSSNAVVADQFLILTTNTNDAPTLAKPIADQGAKEDSAFSFTLPADTFNDVDADDTLTLSATLDNGSPLPTWLTFTPDTGVFSGTPANADVGSLSIKVTATDSSNAVVADQFLILTANTNDSPTGTVVITGTPTQGQTLTADTSAIADDDGLGSFSYQWKANGVDINGANQSSFALTQAQVGKAISVTASYTDGGKTAETLTSAATAAVANTNDSPTGTVVITGTPTQGQTLTADTSAIADDDGLGSFSYQWKANGVDINGANQSSFALTQAQVGKAISVTASYTDGGKTAETLTSTATAAVTNSNDSPTGTVVITGTPTQGQTLTADTSAIADDDGLGSFSYQWKADGVDINGANQSSFALTQAQVGKAISVTASYTDGGKTAETLTSAATAAVANTNDSPTGTVVITGTPTQGQTLTADTSAIADDDGLGSFSYQWKANGVDINGANQSTFALTQAQVGKAISVTASYTDGGKTAETLTSTATAAVTNSNDSPTGTVVVTGTPTQGQTLTADTSAIADDDGVGFVSYQWKADGVDINGANQNTFALTQDQVGKAISVTASYTDGWGTVESLSSAATSNVQNVNDKPTVLKAIVKQNAKEDEPFSYKIAADTFADVDEGDTLSLSATLSEGSPLPSWVTFNPATGLFSGTPLNTDVGSVTIKLTASDTAKASASSTFQIDITNTNDTPTGKALISIDGEVVEEATAIQEKQTLTADTTNIADEDNTEQIPIIFSYQWYANSAPIPAATTEALTLIQSHVGKSITVKTSYTDQRGSKESLISAATSVVRNFNDPPSGSALISGETIEDQALKVVTSSISDADGLGTFYYQWKADGVDINGANTNTLALTQAHVGKPITVSVIYTDGQGENEIVTSAATGNIENINDDPTGSVTIKGTASQGQTLTADISSIADDDGLGAFSYQWKADGVDINGATAKTIALTQDQVGKAISVTASYTDAGNTAETMTSAATAAVTNSNDSPKGTVVIIGTTTQGQTLTADTSAITDGDGLGTFSYQWKADGVDINGATQSTFALTQEQVSRPITVKASYTDGQGTTESLTSAATNNIENINDEPNGNIKISGIPIQNETLTAAIASINDVDGVPSKDKITFQWLKANGTAIAGANSSEYVLTADDVGQKIKVQVSYEDGFGTKETLTSDATASVINRNDSPTGTVVITGTPTQGQTLNADTSAIADDDGLGSFSYQWKADGVDINGANQSTFALSEAQVGKAISVTASYTDGGNTAEALTSAATAAVANTNDSPTGTVVITGTPTQGQTLTADTSAIADADGLGSFSYQWKADGVDINGANQSTFALSQAQVGKAISVTASYTDGGNKAEALTSTATAAVANSNDSPIGKAVVNGQAATGFPLKAVTESINDLDGLGPFSYQWKANDVEIIGETNQTFVPEAQHLGRAISFTVTYKDLQGTSESIDSESTLPVVSAESLLEGYVSIESIDSTIKQGIELSANIDKIKYNGQAIDNIQYQWFADGEPINGEVDKSFTPKQEHVSQSISVEVREPVSGASRVSELTTPVLNENDAPQGVVVTTGTPTQGQTLTADTSAIADADGLGSFSYQWKADGVDIHGATARTLDLSQDQVGKSVTVAISYTDGHDTNESLTSATTDKVGNKNDNPVGDINIRGFLVAGQTLQAVERLSDLDGLGDRTFVWQRSIDGDSWTSIKTQADPNEADHGFYPLSREDAGHIIRVIATYTDKQGTPEAVQSKSTGPVISQLSEGRKVSYESVGNPISVDWEIRESPLRNWTKLANQNDLSLLTDKAWGGQQVRIVVDGIVQPEIDIISINSGVGSLPPLEADGPLVEGVTITAGLPLNDPDGLDINNANLQYTWQSFNKEEERWKAIRGENNSNLRTSKDNVGKQIRSLITYVDKQNYRNEIYSNSVLISPVALPTPEGAFNTISDDGIFTAADYAASKDRNTGKSFIELSGIITNNQASNTTVSIEFGGQIRKATVGEPSDGISNWSYKITENDQQFLIEGEANPIKAIFTQTDSESRVGTKTYSNNLIISPDIKFAGKNPNSAADPSQSDGIKQEVKEAAKEVLSDALPAALISRIGLPNVAAAPLGSANSFETGSDAPAESFGVFDLPGNSSAAGLETYTQGGNGYSIPNQSGGTDAIPAPDKNSLATATDPIALTIKDIDPGATIQVDFILPQASADQLPTDLNQARYFKLNNISGKFTDYLKDDGSKYYTYSLIKDANNNGSRDSGDAVKLTLQLTDGDSKWDRDTIANGVIVDPGILGGNVNDAPTGNVTITGIPTQGQTLTADTSTIADADGLGSFSYQWKADGVDINGANQSTFALSQAQVGKAISVTASYTDRGNTAEALTSAATAAVTNTNDSPTGTVVITGTPTQGQTLTADTSAIADADGLGSFSYQWKADGVDINGANQSTFALTQAQVGKAISVTASYTDGGNTAETLTSAATAAVANTNDSPTGTVVITGTPTQGQTLTADTSAIADADGLGSFSYQWKADGVDINGANQSTFALTQAQVGKAISVTASYTDRGNTAEALTSAATAAVANTNDSPTGTVVITGTPTQGQTLTADTSAIADADGLGSFSYQWKANGVDINGANQNTFALSQAQVGKAISVTASYTDGGNTAEALTSAATAAVANTNDSPTGTVVITGTPTQGQTLTADTSAIADDDGLGSFSYQWKADGVDINGANQSTFALSQAQVGKAISVTASYTDRGNTAEALTSAATAAVTNTNDSPTGTVVITGTPTQGQTLTADTSAIADADGLGSFSYQWKADGVAINGANQNTFALTQAQVGKAISVTASYTDRGNTAEALTSAATAAVANTNDSPTGTVVITGTPTQGQTLTADTSAIADADGLGAFSYQWKADGVDINGATAKTIALTQAQVGKAISVTASYTDGGNTAETLTSAATAAVTNTNDSPTGTVVITGTPTQGQTLTADTSAIADDDGLGAFSYQWKANGVDINGANQSTFALSQAQVGKAISVTASYTDGGNTAEALTSAATAAVTNTNDSPTGTVVITGTPTQGQTLTADTSAIADADGLGSFSYQWKADGVDINGATGKTFVPTQKQVGKAITTVVSYIDGEDTNESLTSPDKVVISSAPNQDPTPTPQPTPNPTPDPTPTPQPTPNPTPDPTPTPQPTPNPTPTPDPQPTQESSDIALPDNLDDIDADGISRLTPSAVAEITADQINDLAAESFQGFNAEQIEQLNPNAFAALDGEKIDALKSKTFQALSAEQIAEITVEAISAIDRKQIKQLEPNAIAGFDKKQIDALKSKTFQALSAEQIAEITVAAISAIDKKQIKQLEPDAIAGFDNKQIEALRPKIFQALTAEQIAGIDDDAISAIDKEQIKQLEPDAIGGFQADQVDDLKPSTFKGISAEQLAEFTPAAIDAITPDQIKRIKPEAVQGLSKLQLKVLEPTQVAALPKKLIKAMDPYQLSNLTKDAITGLSKSQLRAFSSDALTEFSRKQIKALPADAIPGLKPAALNTMAEAQIQAFTTVQLLSLSKKQLRKAPSFLNQLTSEQRTILGLESSSRSNRVIDPLDQLIGLELTLGQDFLA